MVVGSYIRVNLIGKPSIQQQDNKHYIAIRYVGVVGLPLELISSQMLKVSLIHGGKIE